jgi:hypothetical protein
MWLLAALAVLGVAVLTTIMLATQPVIASQPTQSGCAADRFEVNDTYTQTRLIVESSPVVSLTFCTVATGSYNDTDWYAFNVNANNTLNVTASGAGSLILTARGFLQDGVTPVGTSSSTVGSASVVITNSTSSIQQYYVEVKNGTTTNALYSIAYSSSTGPTPTPTPLGLNADAYEPNDGIAESNVATGTRGTSSFIAVGSRIDNLNFTPYSGRPTDSADWFQFYGRGGSIYQVTTLNVQPGVETVMSVYQPVADVNAPNLILVAPLPGSSNPNNRYQAGQRGSQVTFQVPNGGDGLYWVQLTNADPSPRVAGQTYSLQVQEILQATPTAGPSATITPFPPTLTPYPGQPDKFEYNGDFEHASLIAPNVKYDGLNFVPWQPPTQDTYDNDFFRLPVKQGIYYTCQSVDPAPGVDTNIIIYNQNRVGIGGNDDISPDERAKGNFASRFSWLASYTGVAYILVGEVNPPRANEAGNHTYSLRCDIGLPATSTPSATQQAAAAVTFVPATPPPPEPTMTPYPTPRSAQNLPVRQIGSALSTPTPQPTVPVRKASLNVQIFNDANKNGLLDPGEGITGVSVHLSDEQSGAPLAQSLTDGDGRVSFNLVNPGPLRLSVPLFGYSLLVNEDALTVRIAVLSAVILPDRIP